ncbi:redoxin domain-containing protein [Sphingosinicella sp.]|uniref:redoxin domain-containing protein n=1 Tax=Sphingosinicella sp. TaxID=1917971 RepID=UPI0035AFB9DE
MKTRSSAPPLAFPLTAGGHWSLAASTPETFDLIVFYRGLHCPLCRRQLAELETALDTLSSLGVEAVAVSMDTAEKAETAARDWNLKRLRLGHGLAQADARRWGLFLSAAIREGEPPVFSEPGLFLVKPDKTLFYAGINSAPWGRPHIEDIISGIRLALERGTPARGEA